VLVKFDVDGVEETIDSVIGVKQGGILGPILFNFLLYSGSHDGMENAA
jgi:hypothetical protein